MNLKELFLKYKTSIIQLIKFNFVGIMNTLIDMGVLYLLTTFGNLDSLAAKPLSYACGIINSFIMNKLWIFRHKKQSFNGPELLKFLTVNGITLGLSMAALKAMEVYLGIAPAMGNMFVVGIALVINFTLYKFWVFKDKNHQTVEKTDEEPAEEKPEKTSGEKT